MLKVLDILNDAFIFYIIYWILFNKSRWNNPTCCLSDTVNTMPVDVLAS